VDHDISFYMRTAWGDASYENTDVTMSPAFRRMLRELDGTRSVSELASLFPHLDAEDLDLWISELLRQKMIQQIPARLASASARIREAAPAPAAGAAATPAAPAQAEREVRQIAAEIQPWLAELGRPPSPVEPGRQPGLPEAGPELSRTARMAAVEASTTASSIGREGFFMSPGSARQPLAADAQRLILVVEDDELQALMVTRILESEGYRVRVAASGKAANGALLERPVPDVVLLDVELPDTDGFSILKQMRAHPVFQLLRVVMLTSRADRADIAKGILLGADGYLTKPFRPEMIKMAIRQALQAA